MKNMASFTVFNTI